MLFRDVRDLSREGAGRDGPGRDGPGRDGPGRDGPGRDILDERRRVWADDHDTRVEIHPDGLPDLRVDVRTNPRGEVRLEDRDVRMDDRARDRSTDTRDSRGRTDRDRAAQQDIPGKLRN